MNGKIIVLQVKKWDVDDEKTGEKKSGIKVFYINGDSLKPCVDSRNNSMGYSILSNSVSVEKSKNIASVPGIYEGTFIMADSKGKLQLKLDDLKFVKEL